MITLILIVSVLFNLVLCYATVNLLRKNEMQEDQMEEKDGMIYLYGMAAQKAYADMQSIDATGAFEVDDEVGSIFETLKNVISDHARYMGMEVDEEERHEEEKG